MRALAEAEGLDLEIDSAATGDWHTGEPPYPPAVAAAAARGYDISEQQARTVTAADFDRFDMVIAMDGSNYERLQAIRGPNARAALKRLMDYATEIGRDAVPDPYYTGDFEEALDLIEAGTKGLLAAIRS